MILENINNKLNLLSNNKFRNSFHLKEKDFRYIDDKGLDKIREHAYDFINNRLSDVSKVIDGKQTPMRGHPVFTAQHATATCCRGCINKWHKFSKDVQLTKEQQKYLVDLIMEWIKRQVN